MEEVLQHDPRTKLQIKEALYSFLYQPTQQRLSEKLNLIIKRNTLITGSSSYCFTYKGIWYMAEQTNPPKRIIRLIPELHKDMDEYLSEIKELNDQELPYVLGFINQVLNSSNDFQDYLKLFPESIHRPIQKMIDSCPCRTKKLSEEDVQLIQTKNQYSITLIKQRMARNLII